MKQKTTFLCLLITILLSGSRICYVTAQTLRGTERMIFSNTDTNALREKIEETRKFSLQFPDSAYRNYEILLTQSRQQGYRRGTITTLVYSARIDAALGRYAKAVEKFSIALQLCDTNRYRKFIAEVYNNLGSVYNSQARFENALQAFYKAIHFDNNMAYYNNLANVLAQLKQFEKAIKYIDEALPYAQAAQQYSLWCVLLINKGMCYYELKDYEHSKKYTEQGIRLAAQHQLYREQNSGLLNLGLIYIAINQPQKALSTLREAIALYQKPGMTAKEQNETISILGEVYLQLKDYASAEKQFQLAWQNADILPKERLYISQKLAELYAHTGRHAKAYALQQQYMGLKDSLQSKEVAVSVNELETKYRTLEKDKVIMGNQLQIAEQKKRLITKNIWILSITGGALLIIVFLAWRYTYQRQKNKRLKSEREVDHLKAIMEGEEKERSRLAHDLHDGVSSQLAATKSYLLAMQQSFPVLSDSEYYNKVKQMLSTMTLEVRQIAHNLAPDDLLLKGLPMVVHEFCDSIFAGKSLQTEVQVYGNYADLDTRLSLSIYRVIQELLHNVLKHAQATEVILVLNRNKDHVSLTVEDNGMGIPEESLKGTQTGIGLSGLKERVKAQNGSLFIEAGKERGTTINIIFHLPLPSEKTSFLS